MAKCFKIAITTGDRDGIGSEVASKALSLLGPQEGVQFLIWRSLSCPPSDLQRLHQSSFSYTKVVCWEDALKVPHQYNLVDIESHTEPPPRWVEQSAVSAENGEIDAMVTAPLSKALIQQSGLKDRGHTDILRRVAGGSYDLFMSFIGDQFGVVLLTDHIPLKEVSQKLSVQRISKGLQHAWSLQQAFFKKCKPIALLGLNPHAGEDGLIGNEEKELFLPALQKVQNVMAVEGLLVPDVAFQEKWMQKYNIFVASYHDQGLIPFKSLHKSYTGVQVTMGLHFVRTSVDHGTAKDIFSQDKANPQSMLHAIKIALRLLKSKFVHP